MNQLYVKLVNEIYKEMKNNIDIIQYWFEADDKVLDEKRLFIYKKELFSSELGNESDIYVFVNKLINNLLYVKNFKLKNLTYLEENFVALINVVIENFNNSMKVIENECD